MPHHTLPVHPRTGERATGWRKPRPGEIGPQPVWAIRGGAEPEGDPKPEGEPPPPGSDPKPDPKPEGDPAGDPEPEDDPKLGEAGEKALKAEREARKAADKKTAELEAEVSRLRRANAANKGTDVEAIKAEIRSEVEKSSAARVIRAEVKAAAAAKLADPSDAVKLLDLSQFELDADGDVDAKAIAKALDDLLKAKPYLAGKRPWGDVGGGHREPAAAEVEPGMGRLRHAYATSSKTK